MKRMPAIFPLVVAIVLLAGGAFAQATRTWVSGVGDDANPCSRTAPCKTFAGAISKTAAGGEISVLDPGGYGAVTITKSITISGDGTLAGILASGTNGIVINASTTDVVTLRHLEINGVGRGYNGINWIAGGELHVVDCEIEGFNFNAIYAHPTANKPILDVTNTNIRYPNSPLGKGIVLTTVASQGLWATLDRVRITGMSTGISAIDQSNVVVRDSIIVDSGTDGVAAAPSTPNNPANVVLERTIVQNNKVGLHTATGGTIHLSDSVVTQNSTAISAAAGSVISYGDNRINGNFGGETVPATTPTK